MSDPLPAVLQAIAFIEERLSAAITVDQMAAAAGYSVFHFVRVFNAAVGHTPYDYLVRRRLTEAARMLADSDRKVIDIALDLGFNSPEVFTRAFRRMFDRQPSECRTAGIIDPRFYLARRTAAHLRLYDRPDFHPPEPVERPAVRLAGFMSRIKDERGDCRSLWAALEREISRQPDHAGDRTHYGVRLYPPDWPCEGPFYLAATELRDGETAGFPQVTQQLPGGTYACFRHPGEEAELDLARDFIYSTWLPRTGQQTVQPVEVTRYGASPPAGDEQPGRTFEIPLR